MTKTFNVENMSSEQTNTTQQNIDQTEEPPSTLNGKVGRIKKWAFRVDHNENRVHAVLRSLFRILFIMNHEFANTAITLRASALTYSIVLSMVPMLAMSTAVLKGLGKDNQLKTAAYALIDQLEPAKTQQQDPLAELSFPSGSTAQEGENSTPLKPESTMNKEVGIADDDQSMTTHLRNAVDTIFDYVDRTNFAAIGSFGIVGLLLAVILVLSTIESAMNDIWHTKHGRSLSRKVMDYLALLILLPISINIALAGDAVLESPQIMSYIHTIIPSAWAVKMLLKLLPFLFVILTLTLMYQFFPNVRVQTHAAFAGALFAGFFWFVAQRVYIILQIGVANYNAIYGSFATLPLFLIWIHLGWTFILLGAILAYAVQNRHQYHLPGAGGSPQKDLQLAFDILNTIYSNFARKEPTSLDDLAQANRGDLPGDIQEITNRLIDGGLVFKTDNNCTKYVPATPSENIEAREVVKLIFGNEAIPTLGGHFSSQVVQAAEKAIPGDAFPRVEQSQTNLTDPDQKIKDEETL